MIKCFVLSYGTAGVNAAVNVFLVDSTTVNTGCVLIPLSVTISDTDATVEAGVASAVNNYCTTNGIPTPSSFDWNFTTPADLAAALTAAIPAAPSSYQTIVSQTGTTAPAVSGSLVPTTSYPAGTTFAWARTGAGVYTLTASAAVFSTTKTGVFIQPLTNLNASVRGVVTSSTVVTFTTAVQSVAILGLLGLTATNTDALLSNTMIYVQTYA